MRIFRVEYETYDCSDEGLDELVEADGVNVSTDGDAEEAIVHAKRRLGLNEENQHQYFVITGVELLAEADI